MRIWCTTDVVQVMVVVVTCMDSLSLSLSLSLTYQNARRTSSWSRVGCFLRRTVLASSGEREGEKEREREKRGEKGKERESFKS